MDDTSRYWAAWRQVTHSELLRCLLHLFISMLMQPSALNHVNLLQSHEATSSVEAEEILFTIFCQ